MVISMVKTYKLVELVGISDRSFSAAAESAVAKAAQTLHHTAWFEVIKQRGQIRNGKVAEYQVKGKVAFRVLDHEE